MASQQTITMPLSIGSCHSRWTQFSYDDFLSHQQLVVDSSTAIVELHSKGRELTPKCVEHRNVPFETGKEKGLSARE